MHRLRSIFQYLNSLPFWTVFDSFFFFIQKKKPHVFTRFRLQLSLMFMLEPEESGNLGSGYIRHRGWTNHSPYKEINRATKSLPALSFKGGVIHKALRHEKFCLCSSTFTSKAFSFQWLQLFNSSLGLSPNIWQQILKKIEKHCSKNLSYWGFPLDFNVTNKTNNFRALKFKSKHHCVFSMELLAGLAAAAAGFVFLNTFICLEIKQGKPGTQRDWC